MKNRLYVLAIAAMMLFIPAIAFGRDLSTNISALSGQNIEITPPSGFPDDTIIQFPDPNFEAAVRELTHKPKRDIVASDVAEITELDVSELDIADLTGIEYFTALEVLSCADNQLTTLDVSHNPALIELTCEYNQLATLDVSQNPVLEVLGCGANQLTVLDVSQNTALQGLYCWTNQLTTLDISHNTALKELYCNSNQLTTLDISHNIVLVRLSCSNNLLPDKSAIIGLDENSLYLSFDLQNVW
jgi:Leucine-rich repeat (LRR) protein